MTAQATKQGRRQGSQGMAAQVAMTAISLAILGGFVLWQVRPDGGPPSGTDPADGARSVDGPSEQHQARPRDRMDRVPAEELPSGGLVELYGEQEAAAQTVTRQMYLVDSETDAQRLIGSGASANPNLARQAAQIDSVTWFDSDEAQARFWSLIGEGDAVRDRLDLPPLTVIDLRGDAGMTCAENEGTIVTAVRDLCQ